MTNADVLFSIIFEIPFLYPIGYDSIKNASKLAINTLKLIEQIFF